MPCMKLENDGDATGRQTHCIQPRAPLHHVQILSGKLHLTAAQGNNSMHF